MIAIAPTKERPILFSGAMVRAILEGRKIQTRRIVKPQPTIPTNGNFDGFYFDTDTQLWTQFYRNSSGEYVKSIFRRDLKCPYGKVGDRLWLRETHAHHPDGEGIIYRATDPGWDDENTGVVWKPSIFMPRAASRITLELTDIRVERLQDISEKDAIAEGIELPAENGASDSWEKPLLWTDYLSGEISEPSAVRSFQSLWQSINAKTHPWETNPWVWVLGFKVLEVSQREVIA